MIDRMVPVDVWQALVSGWRGGLGSGQRGDVAMTGEAKGYGEFVRGWPVVLSSMLGIGLGLSPLPFYTMGSMAPALHQAFGWSFGQIFFGITVTTACVILVSPLIGAVSDRFGVRRVALTSLFLFALSFMALSLSTGSLLMFYINWALVATLGAGTLPITWTRAVNNWFDERKGAALGLSLVGTGVFGYLVKPFTATIIGHYGWRAAYLSIGALPLLFALPVAFLCFRDVGPAQATAAERKALLAAQKAAASGLTVRQVFTHWRFWLIALAYVPISFTVGGAIPNLENILKLAGFGRGDVVTLASIIGLSVVFGRALSGWLLDRLWAPAVALAMLGVPASACWMLAHGPYGYGYSALAVFMIGFAAGAEYDLMAFFVARYFGMKSYSVAYASLYSFFSFGAGVGPVVFGAVFDKTHSYTEPLIIAGGMMLGGSILLLGLGRYPQFELVSTGEILMEAEAVPHTLPI